MSEPFLGCVEAIRRRLSRAKAPSQQETSDLGVLWHLLHLILHPNAHISPSSYEEDHRQLSRAEFQLAFGLGWNAAIIKRIFDMLDTDDDDLISLRDFAIGLFPLASARATLDDRLRFLFDCFALDGSGAVSREAMLVHLHLYATQGFYADDCAMPPKTLEAVVEATFMQAARSQKPKSPLVRPRRSVSSEAFPEDSYESSAPRGQLYLSERHMPHSSSVADLLSTPQGDASFIRLEKITWRKFDRCAFHGWPTPRMHLMLTSFMSAISRLTLSS